MDPLWWSQRLTQALLYFAERVRGEQGVAEQWHLLMAGGCGQSIHSARATRARACLAAAQLVVLWSALCVAATLTMLTGFCAVGLFVALQTLQRAATQSGMHTVAFRL